MSTPGISGPRTPAPASELAPTTARAEEAPEASAPANAPVLDVVEDAPIRSQEHRPPQTTPPAPPAPETSDPTPAPVAAAESGVEVAHPDFAELRDAIRAVAPDSNAEHEALEIIDAAGAQTRAFLNALQTERFASFSAMLEERFRLGDAPVSQQLSHFVRPQSYELLRSERTAYAFDSMLDAGYPASHLGTLDSILSLRSLAPDRTTAGLASMSESELQTTARDVVRRYETLVDEFGPAVANDQGLGTLAGFDDTLMASLIDRHTEFQSYFGLSVDTPRDFSGFLRRSEAFGEFFASSENVDRLLELRDTVPEAYAQITSSPAAALGSHGFLTALEHNPFNTLAEAEEFLGRFERSLADLGAGALQHLAEIDAPRLAADPEFERFLETVEGTAAYEALSRSSDFLPQLSGSYEAREELAAIDGLMERFGIPADDGFLDAQFPGERLDLLQLVESADLGLSIDDPARLFEAATLFGTEPFTAEHYARATAALDDPETARAFVDALRSHWGGDALSIEDVLTVAASERGADVFSAERQEDYEQLRELYPAVAPPRNGGDVVRTLDFLTSDGPRFLDSETAAIMNRYVLDPHRERYGDELPEAGYPVSSLSGRFNFDWVGSPHLPKIVDEMSALGLNEHEISQALDEFQSEEVLLDFFDDERARQAFAEVRAFGQEAGLSFFQTIDLATETSQSQAVMPAVRGLHTLGFDVSAREVREQAAHYARQPEVLALLEDPEFLSFYNDTMSTLYTGDAGSRELDSVRTLGAFFDATRDDSRLREAFHAPEFSEFQDFVSEEFAINSIPVSNLGTAVDMAMTDLPGLRSMVERVRAEAPEVDIVSGDLFLYQQLARDPALAELFFDRSALEEAVTTEIYRQGNPAREREVRLGEPLPLEYTERPELGDANRRHLLGALLVSRALRDDGIFRAQLEALIEQDITDTRTERGGFLVFEDSGALRLRESYSYSEFDGSYISEDSTLLPPGIQFHLHALHDDNASDGYAGPSGSVETSGDLGYAHAVNIVQAVFTTAGRNDTGRLVFNSDVYDIVRPFEGGDYDLTIDLGTRDF